MTKERSKRDVVERLADPGFIPPDHWTERNLSIAETKRLRSNTLMAAVAATARRREGADASTNDLAADKYISRAIGHTYLTLWKRMTIARHAPLLFEELSEEETYLYPPHSWENAITRANGDDEFRQMGSTVIWINWWEELRPRLKARERALATFALRQGCTGWGYRVVSSIESELTWIESKFVTWSERYRGGRAE